MEFDLREEIENGLEGVIYWRTEKAAEYPNDDSNCAAVDIAKRLLAGDKTISQDIQARFAQLAVVLEVHPDVDDLLIKVSEANSEIFRSIGFWSEPPSFDAIATDICDAVDAILANAEEPADAEAAAKSSLLDYPLHSGKLLRDATCEDIVAEMAFLERDGKAHQLKAAALATTLGEM